MNEEILIEFDANGDMTVEGKNISGSDCVALTEEIEKAVGTVAKRVLKPDYHRPKQNVRKVGV